MNIKNYFTKKNFKRKIRKKQRRKNKKKQKEKNKNKRRRINANNKNNNKSKKKREYKERESDTKIEIEESKLEEPEEEPKPAIYRKIKKEKKQSSNPSKKEDYKSFRVSKQRRIKMQREINNEVHLGQTVTPFESIGKSSAIDKTASDFDSTNQKVK